VDELTSYPLLRGSVSADGAIMTRLRERLQDMECSSIDASDGLRLTFEDGWLLIRPSGTEPKIRVTAEARSQGSTQRLYNLGIEAIKECTKG